MSFYTQYSTTEWNLAIALMVYIVLDFLVRFHSAYTALRNNQRIIDYYSGWMTVQLYQEWFMFIRWNRVIAYILMLLFLHHVNCHVLFLVLLGKFLLEFVYHMILKHFLSHLL